MGKKKTAGRIWSREEVVLAINLYCKLPFGRYVKANPEVINLARMLSRTPSSVSMKLGNLASLDPWHKDRGVRGLGNASKVDRQVWNEFQVDWTGLAAESEQLLEQYKLKDREPDLDCQRERPTAAEYEGKTEILKPRKVRLAQRFFRQTVLASFNSQCCISEISLRSLLVASHIVPWKSSEEHRANPHNGLCLSRIHDGAFDQGLITFDSEFRLVLSRELKEHCANETMRACFLPFEGQKMKLPQKFLPDQNLLERHRTHLFR